MDHNSYKIIDIFNQCFMLSERTILVLGESEPIYLPAGQRELGFPYNAEYHQVVFAHGFFSSALHEIAHWCIAGSERRKLMDYGYWYEPEGRNQEQQKAFELVEVKPQAIELAFSKAAKFDFNVSLDNFADFEIDRKGFERRVVRQFECYQHLGFPPRAQIFIQALEACYRGEPASNMNMANPKTRLIIQS